MSLIARRTIQKSLYYTKKTRSIHISRYNLHRITKSTQFTPKLSTISIRLHHCEQSNSVDARTRDYAYNWREHNKPSTTSSTDFDPSNTAQVFQSFSTYQLIKYNLMFSMLGIEPLTNIMIQIMKKIVGTGTPQKNEQQKKQSINKSNLPFDIPGLDAGIEATSAILGIAGNVLSKPLIYLVRKQYFPLFTGGESIDDCIKLAKRYYDNNIRLIVDNSTEEGHTHDIYAHNLALKKELVDVASDKLPAKTVVYMAVKMTSLSSPTLLEEMTDIINREKPTDRDPTGYMNDTQLQELEYTLSNLTECCQYAKDKGIGVWLDAEQYARQPAMNYLSRRLMQIINTDSDKIYLYNTYQCYLKDAHDWISFDIEHAKSNGYVCGIKLVRGAYMDYEAKIAKQQNQPNPIHNSKEETDRGYNTAVNYVLNEIVESYGNVAIAVCTHNRESLQNATETMKRLGIERDDPSVVTAQLNGMVDNLTYALGYNGYNALKLIPYGAFDDVWPFLMRRLEENSQILNGSQQERKLYTKEIKRRFTSFIGM